MLAFIFASMAIAGDAPVQDARLINREALRDAKLSVSEPPSDFPEGSATMTLQISAKGRMTACRAATWGAKLKRDPTLESMICDALRKKAKFDPALDGAGRPVDSSYTVLVDPIMPYEPELTGLEKLFTAEDYPLAALRLEKHGIVTVRLVVDAKGRAIECEVVKSSDSPILDQRTCEIFKRRGSFTPGKDANGRPIAGTSINRVSWQFPDRRPLSNSTLRTSLTFDVDGNVTKCESYWGDDYMKKEACRLLKTVAFKALTPVQRAYRTLIKEEGLVVGSPQAADLVGRHRGEQRLLMVSAYVSIDRNGAVTKCEASDPGVAEQVAPICADLRKTKYSLDEEEKAKPDLGAVSYTALILRRAGY